MVLQATKDAQKKIAPSELFRNETDKYSQFDDKVFLAVRWFKGHTILVKKMFLFHRRKLTKLVINIYLQWYFVKVY